MDFTCSHLFTLFESTNDWNMFYIPYKLRNPYFLCNSSKLDQSTSEKKSPKQDLYYFVVFNTQHVSDRAISRETWLLVQSKKIETKKKEDILLLFYLRRYLDTDLRECILNISNTVLYCSYTFHIIMSIYITIVYNNYDQLVSS